MKSPIEPTGMGVSNQMQLSSAFSDVRVFGGCSIRFDQHPQKSMLLIRVEQSTDGQCQVGMHPLCNDAIVIGVSPIGLQNRGTAPMCLRGLVFTAKEQLSMQDVRIVDRHEADNAIFTDIIASGLHADEEEIPQIVARFDEQLRLLEAKRGSDSDSGADNKSKLWDSRLLIVNRYIRNHYAEPITLETLAALIGCNPVYFSNTYSKVFQISPMKYLQSVRMSKSLELLTETDLSITEISNAVGYVTVSQFGTIFKRYYRITPYEYRIKHAYLKSGKSNGGG